MGNIAYCWQPKYVSPLNDGKTYLIVAKRDTIPHNGKAYVVVTNSPRFSGLYRIPVDLLERARTYMNNKLPCWLLDINELIRICDLEEIKNDQVQEKIKKKQEDYKQYRLMKRLSR